MYELLHGKTPFRSNAPLEIQKNIIDGDYEFGEDVSKDAVDLITKILKPDPKNRPSIVQLLTHSLISVKKYF